MVYSKVRAGPLVAGSKT